MFDAVRQLNTWIREAIAKPLVYMTWAKKDEPDQQARMTKAFRQAAEEANALLAPVGELWWEYRKNHPEYRSEQVRYCYCQPDQRPVSEE